MVESVDFSNISYDEYCHYHNQIEPSRDGDYKVCGECGHVYRTERELRKTYFRLIYMGTLWAILTWPFWTRKIDNLEMEIFACPLCGHDF